MKFCLNLKNIHSILKMGAMSSQPQNVYVISYNHVSEKVIVCKDSPENNEYFCDEQAPLMCVAKIVNYYINENIEGLDPALKMYLILNKGYLADRFIEDFAKYDDKIIKYVSVF